MSNLKKVPFDLKKWKADGSHVDRLEMRNGRKIEAFHVFEVLNVDYPIAAIDSNGHNKNYTINGDYTTEREGCDSDLFMYIEQPKEITCGDWLAIKGEKESWFLFHDGKLKSLYEKKSDSIKDISNLLVNKQALLDLANIVSSINAEPE
jgi:hypothetical protein